MVGHGFPKPRAAGSSPARRTNVLNAVVERLCKLLIER